MSDAEQLQDLVDGLAARLRRAVMLDDPRLRLIAYSQTGDDVDPVRVRSILRRESPDDVRAWLFDHGLHELREPTLLPAVAELAMGERLVCPVYHEDALLGYLWLPGDAGHAEAAAAAAPVADAIGIVLYRRRFEETSGRIADVTEIARSVFEQGGGPVAAVRLLATASESVALDLHAALERALRRATGGHGRCLSQDGDLLLAGAPAAALRTALLDTPAARPAGLGEHLVTARRAACLAGLLGMAAPLTLDDVPLEAQLLELAGDDPAGIVVPALVEPLLEAIPAVAELRATVEAYLDHGGDVRATVAALHVSRAGLYRRLHRAEAITGLDLHDGPRRTLVHLGLKAARLTGR